MSDEFLENLVETLQVTTKALRSITRRLDGLEYQINQMEDALVKSGVMYFKTRDTGGNDQNPSDLI